MILQSNDEFDEVADFDAATRGFRYYSKALDPKFSQMKSHGRYAKLDGHLIALFVAESEIRLLVDAAEYLIGNQTSTGYIRSQGTNALLVFEGERLILRFEYNAADLDPPLTADPSACIDDEDFDFPLFVHNLLSDPARRRVFIDVNK